MTSTEVIIVGAGPLGLELAVALQRTGIDYVQIDAGQVGQTILDWPTMTRWFSSPDRITIAGVPIQTVSQEKCTREEYLAYLRGVVMQFDLDVRTYERVLGINRKDNLFTVISLRLAMVPRLSLPPPDLYNDPPAPPPAF